MNRRIEPSPLPTQLVTLGCAGAIIGLIMALCGLSAVAVLGAFSGSVPNLPTDSSKADITITIQEAYLVKMMGQSLPAGWVNDPQIDVQPGNNLVFKGGVQASLAGQKLTGDISAIITLNASNGRLVMGIKDVKVMGFALSGIGEKYLNDLSTTISQVIDKQMKAGLGSNAYILSVATDDRQLVIQARWQ